MTPRGRPPGSTPEEIIEAFKRNRRNVTRVCRELHISTGRVTKVLDVAGFTRTHRNQYRKKAKCQSTA